ncbi:MAG: tetratricopeptide repeat protein [Simkaniaceae bacterium]
MTSCKRLKTISFFCLTLFTSCNRVGTEHLEPEFCFTASDLYINNLPAPFRPLNEEEKHTNWGREYTIGLAFARELDLYRAITAFKRAEIMIDKALLERKREVQYNILLSYYLGKRYEEVIETFNHSLLRQINEHFPVYNDLLLILYESHLAVEDHTAATLLLEHIRQNNPELEKKLTLSHSIKTANFKELNQNRDLPFVDELLTCYCPCQKSIARAELYNMLIPGAGYLYVGQKQSAVTAFFLNALFIGASTYFFLDGNIAAGAIFASFEAGWYFGGIYGAGEAAKLYNERIYETCAGPLMKKHRLYPLLSLRYGF